MSQVVGGVLGAFHKLPAYISRSNGRRKFLVCSPKHDVRRVHLRSLRRSGAGSESTCRLGVSCKRSSLSLAFLSAVGKG